MAEVTNTPWHERHRYVLPPASARRDGAALRLRTPQPRLWLRGAPFHAQRRTDRT